MNPSMLPAEPHLKTLSKLMISVLEHLGIWYHTGNQAPALQYVHPNISLWFWDMVYDLYPREEDRCTG